MSKATIATIFAAVAAGFVGAAGVLPEPYRTILIQASVIVAAFGGVFGATPQTEPANPKGRAPAGRSPLSDL